MTSSVADMIERGPIPAVHGVVRWRLIDLAQWIFEEFRITIAKMLSRSYAPWAIASSARPRHHAQAQGAIEDFKKASQGAWKKSARKGARLRHDRNLVRRRSSYRPEEQDYPSLGETRHPPKRTA